MWEKPAAECGQDKGDHGRVQEEGPINLLSTLVGVTWRSLSPGMVHQHQSHLQEGPEPAVIPEKVQVL